MDNISFFIRRFVLEGSQSVKAVKLHETGGSPGVIPGYFVMSSAPPNIEDAVKVSPEETANTQAGVAAIADDLWRILKQSDQQTAPELVILVHGYNTRMTNVKAWYGKIFRYTNTYDNAIAARPHQVFIGFRWPSETVKFGQLGAMVTQLPPLPKGLMALGAALAAGLALTRLLLQPATIWGTLLSVGAGAGIFLVGLLAALVLLRTLGYFRDQYRATNFGVLDLVELLRQIDQAMVQRQADAILKEDPTTTKATWQARQRWRDHLPKVRLSFVGHSMGGLVVTNAMRILSDVFDTRSIDKVPTPDIGMTFRLERLVLASPDIPVLTLISSRANFLASSLRRFSETYLFSSEGDIALRIASTAANYISFPSCTQTRGYRLGNVALRTLERKSAQDQFGLVNLDHLKTYYTTNIPLAQAIALDPDKIMENLFVTYSRRHQNGYVTLADLFEEQFEEQFEQKSARPRTCTTLADLFTFFDCTDYHDRVFDVETQKRGPKAMGIMTRAQGKRALNLLDYFRLTVDYALGKRDVHGGYFQGEFTQMLLYRLAFLGLEGLLDSLGNSTDEALEVLDQQCSDFGIQGFLSPLRYRVICQGVPASAAQTELLDAMSHDQDETETLLAQAEAAMGGAVTQWPHD
ncbi:alpha/beta hydrolase [Leptolyngbya sp. PCC 6406]|uniref:alpha/beta hydrolase n=1 Tax=Leptolyngbya sp. PCC 6406 TaxID=1173264 RepID=UPI0002ABA865|nr:alpha/beta hydrolase [Leptolyngbya sp. PCC 6406]